MSCRLRRFLREQSYLLTNLSSCFSCNHKSSQKELHSLHNKVLSLEIGVKYTTKSQLGKTFKHLSSQVKSLVFFFTYLSVQQLIRSSAKNQSKVINIRHASKLEALCNGKRFDVNYLDVDKIVVNLSSSTLTDTDVHLLSRGLAFSITPQQLDRIDIQTSFESFYHQLSTGQPESNLARLKQRLRGLCFSYIKILSLFNTQPHRPTESPAIFKHVGQVPYSRGFKFGEKGPIKILSHFCLQVRRC